MASNLKDLPSGSNNDASSNQETTDEDENLGWKEKYELAEKQLSRVRQQTGKVRELLNKKVKCSFPYCSGKTTVKKLCINYIYIKISFYRWLNMKKKSSLRKRSEMKLWKK